MWNRKNNKCWGIAPLTEAARLIYFYAFLQIGELSSHQKNNHGRFCKNNLYYIFMIYNSHRCINVILENPVICYTFLLCNDASFKTLYNGESKYFISLNYRFLLENIPEQYFINFCSKCQYVSVAILNVV